MNDPRKHLTYWDKEKRAREKIEKEKERQRDREKERENICPLLQYVYARRKI
jgi:hypothetical protein